MKWTLVLTVCLVAGVARAGDDEVVARLDVLIEQLGSESFDVRDAAARELATLTWERADLARARLPLKIAGIRSMEVRKRLEGFLAAASGGRWRALPKAPIATRYGDTRLVLPDGRLLIWGGFSFHDRDPKLYADGAIFDPKSLTWTKIADAPIVARSGARAFVVGERVLVLGGVRRIWAALDGAAPRDGAWYDPKKGAWTKIPDVPLPELNDQVVGYGEGLVIVFGYIRGKRNEYVGAKFDVAKGVWTKVECPLERRAEAGLAWTGRHLVVWGGNPAGGYPLGEGEKSFGDGAVWDARTGKWTKTAKAEVGFVPAVSSVLDGSVFFLGGTMHQGDWISDPLAAAVRVDPSDGSVTPIGDAAHPIHHALPLGPVLLAYEPEHASILDPKLLRWSPPLIEGEGEAVLSAGIVAGHPLLLVSDGTARRFDLERFRWLPTTAAPEGATRHVPTFLPTGLFLWGGGDFPTSGRLSPGRMFEGGLWYEPPPK